jgi:hypothetical protein
VRSAPACKAVRKHHAVDIAIGNSADEAGETSGGRRDKVARCEGDWRQAVVGQRDDIPRWYGTGDHQEEGINISVVRPGKERRGGPAGYRDRPRFREVGRRWRAELAPDVKLDRTTGPVIAVAPTGAESASTAIDAKKPSFNPAKRVIRQPLLYYWLNSSKFRDCVQEHKARSVPSGRYQAIYTIAVVTFN